MKKIITLVCLLLLAGTAWAVSLIGSGIGGDECTGALICQNFEGTGYDNGETWTGSNVDPDYSGANVLRGNQSIEFNMDNSTPDASISFTNSGEIWYHERYQTSSSSTAAITLIYFKDASETEEVFRVRYSISGFTLYRGTISTTVAYTMSVNTAYHFWLHLKASDNTAQFYIGTSTTRPTTPLIDGSSGDATQTVVGYLRLRDKAYLESTDLSYRDQIIIKTSEFTSVAE